ncbi:MAG: ABC transporter substrate-binding protein [Chloroflexi bacterium]|nr:ABC transporter substrate-binding protein [Chloroflexota bacterium]
MDMADNGMGSRYWQQRLTRRRLLGATAAGGATIAAITLVGCSTKSSTTPDGTPPSIRTATVSDGTQDGPGKPGGTLRVRQTTALPSMNPFGPSILALAQGLYLGFTVFDHMWYVPTDTGKTELFLATQIEQPDPLTIIVTLGDAVFHNKAPVNGRKVTAQDVAASYKRFRKEIGIGYDYLHNVMDDIVAVDDRTVKITQKFTWAWSFTSSNAGSPITGSILPQEILEDSNFLARDAIGSGQWVLASHDNGANIQLKRFENFRVKGQPLLDGIDNRLIIDDVAGLAAFKAGDIDTFGFNNKTDADDTARALGDKIVIGSDLSRDYLTLMLKYEDPFKDERVRHAFNLMLDRDEARALLEEGNAVNAGPIPPAHPKYKLDDNDPDLVNYFKTDVAEAKKLLDAASFDYSQEHELKHSVRPVDSSVSQVIQQQFARGGVKVKLVPEDLVKWFSQSLGTGNFHMTAFQHLPYEDPDLPLRFYLGGEGDRKNFMGYQDPKVDEAILAAARELDETARIEKVKQAQRVIINAWAPMFNIFSAINYGARYAYVKGSISGRGSYGLFNRTTWLDKS